jgi:ribosome biogenesis protein YTM1
LRFWGLCEIETDSNFNKIVQYPIATMNGHIGAISSVVFDDKDNNKLYSGGWDHSIRTWDVESRTNVNVKVFIRYLYLRNF